MSPDPMSAGHEYDTGPKLPPPRWRVPRTRRGCLANLALLVLGVFVMSSAICLCSGSFFDSMVGRAIYGDPPDSPSVVEAPLPRLPVRQGLRPDSPVVSTPAPADDGVQPDQPGPDEEPKRGGVDEGALFGVQ